MQANANPYASPADSAKAAPPAGELLAPRGARLAAALIDTLLVSVLLVATLTLAREMLLTRLGQDVTRERSPAGLQAFVSSVMKRSYTFALLPALSLYAFQCFLIAHTGQSIGKRWLRLRIVRQSGAPAGFVRGVLLRSWVINLIALIPLIGIVGSLIDALMIFGERSLCLHDRIADTKVVSTRGSEG